MEALRYRIGLLGKNAFLPDFYGFAFIARSCSRVARGTTVRVVASPSEPPLKACPAICSKSGWEATDMVSSADGIASSAGGTATSRSPTWLT